MNHFCINRQELIVFLEKLFSLPNTLSVSHIEQLIEQWERWEIHLTCTATLLSQILEGKQKRGLDVHKILNDIYVLSENRGLFDVEQINERYLDFMFENVRDPSVEIEEDLILIKYNLEERGY